MRLSRALMFIMLFFSSRFILAQKLPFTNYTIKEGLPSNFISFIEQDNKGFMWFATQSGISRFDGYKFDNFGIDKGLPSNDIHFIFVDSKNNLWISALGGGIARYNGYTFKNYSASSGLINDNIKFIFEDVIGAIWAASETGISRIKNDSIISYTKESGLIDNGITCSFVDGKSQIWLGTTRGYSVAKVSETNLKFISHGLEDEIITDIAEDIEGSVWLATQGGGLFRQVKGDDKPLPVKNPFGDIILCINSDDSGNIWFGTYEQGAFSFNIYEDRFLFIEETKGHTIIKIISDKSERIWMRSIKEGLFLHEKGYVRHINTANNLLDNSIMATKVDREGNIWFGTIGGVSKFGKKPFEIYTEDFGLPHKEILTVLSDKKGRIWTGSYNGLAMLSPGNDRFITFDIQNPFSNEVFSIFEDKSDIIWFGTYMGITKYAGNQFKLISDVIWNLGGEAYNYADDFTEDADGNLWIAHNSGVCKFTGNKFNNFTTEEGLPDNQVKAIITDKTGNIWIASVNGLAVFNNNQFHIINTGNGLSNNMCQDICVDKDGNIWVATDNGLNKIVWDDGIKKIESFTTANGLASNAILFVAPDKSDNLWLGLGKGINRMNLTTGRIYYYGEPEGFTPLECYERAVSVDNENNVWIGTGNGLVKYNPIYDTTSVHKPKTYITKIYLYNDTTDILLFSEGIDSVTGLPQNLVLPYNKCNLMFEYVGIHFAIPEKNLYQYMLRGYDEKWSEPTLKTATDPYRRIPHGNYSFQLLAANSDGIWIDVPVTFSFTIKPPFWKTPWAYATGVILSLAVLFLIVRIRERKLQQDKRILALKVKERTVEIEKQRDYIEQQNKEITASIMYAQRIQSAVLPDESLIKKLLPRHFILFKPRDIVSGDFYWITEKDNKVIVVAADCTGHGVPGAFMSMLGVSLLNEIVSNRIKLSAGEILDILRANVKKTLSQKGRQDETKDGMDLTLCIFDFSQMTAQFAGAYNSLMLIRNNELIIYKGDKMPIGIYVGNEKPFTSYNLDLHKNDMIYMCSDGYADQFGGPEEKKFKSGALKDLLIEIHTKPLSEQKDILDQTHEDWKGNLQQIDDIMIIGIKS